MTKKQILLLSAAVLCLLLFCGLILAVLFFDVAPIGPEGSSIGLSTINGAVRDLLPYNETIYKLTGILGYIVIAVALVYTGISNRKNSERAVHDKKYRRYLALWERGVFMKLAVYACALVIYILFEKAIVNYRPIIIPGETLEASFPSSHTLLAVAFIGPAIHDAILKEKTKTGKWVPASVFSVLMASVVVGRLLSGVHWLTDILGGLFIGAALVLAYAFFYDMHYQR